MTQDWIEKQSSDQPWFCWASFQDPHEPFVCPEPWFSQVRTAEIEPFEGVRPGEFDDKPAFYASGWDGIHDQFGVPCVYEKPQWDAAAKTALQATLGMIKFLDHRIGTILKTLEAAGQAQDTIIIFTSDHGEMHGHHGYWGKGLTAYDDCQRVPLIVWGPGRVAAQDATDALANLVDLPKTILTLTGTDQPTRLQGADLSPILAASKVTVQNATMIECRPTHSSFYQQTFVTDRHKLVVYRDLDTGELYDLRDDPDQYVNLWDKPEHAALKLRLLHRLSQFHMEREGSVARENHSREYDMTELQFSTNDVQDARPFTSDRRVIANSDIPSKEHRAGVDQCAVALQSPEVDVAMFLGRAQLDLHVDVAWRGRLLPQHAVLRDQLDHL